MTFFADCIRSYSCDASQYPPIGRAAIWTLYLVILVDFFQLTFVYPFIPSIVESFGGSKDTIASRVALLSSIAAGVEAVANPVLGSLSDRYGRRTVMLCSTVGSAASSVFLGFSKNFPMAIVARVVNSASGGTASIANTYMADVTTPETRPDYMAKITSLIGVGLALGPMVGAALYQAGGVQVACWSAGGISLLNFVCVYLFLKESKPPSPAAGGNAGQQGAAATQQGQAPQAPPADDNLPRTIWVLFCANLFLSPLSVIFDTFGQIYCTEKFYGGDDSQGTSLFSQCVSMIGVCLLVIPMVVYQPVKRAVGFNGTIMLGTIPLCLGLVLNGLAESPGLFLAATLLWASGLQLLGPAIPVLITRLAPPTKFGRAFGIYMTFGNVSRVVGPTALAPVFNWRKEAIFYAMALSLLIMASILLTVARATDPARRPDALCEPEDESEEAAVPDTLMVRALSRCTSDAARCFGNLQGQLPLADTSARTIRRVRSEHLPPVRASQRAAFLDRARSHA